MKGKKIFSGVMALLLAAGGILLSENSNPGYELTPAQMANVEALTVIEPESVLKIYCEGSLVVRCQVTCKKCWTRYEAIGGHGKAQSTIGSCSCGSNSFIY